MTLFPRETTTVRIPKVPKQRRGRHQTPVVVVVPEQLTWGQRLTAAIGRAAWKRRRAFVPTAVAVAALVAAAVAHAQAPGLWLPLAALAMAGPGWLVWATLRRPTPHRRVRTWRVALAAAVLTAGGWAAASVAFGPLTNPLPWLWLLLLLAAHVARHLRRATRTADLPANETEYPTEKESAR
ncbi:hypothetical protein GCM10010218_24590 [Streptomyces mashuensis]|uniref:Uncharacterized protein n=1 Tax=Streptomyces mashuensis TaxID=33904 RepID=A0A919B2E5_9ACTN|nr:hypothetical protein [Streptomyces mashuensis]GHF42516.1 hypothetical protein GCM10010218_24590 [Streptomyces mashuensis]